MKFLDHQQLRRKRQPPAKWLSLLFCHDIAQLLVGDAVIAFWSKITWEEPLTSSQVIV